MQATETRPDEVWAAQLPFLEPLINSLDCGVMLVEEDAGIAVVSHPLAAMFGLSVEDIRRMTPERFTDHLTKLVETPPALLRERRLFPKDGLVSTADLSIARPFRTVIRWLARPLSHPRPACLVVCSDITATQDLSSTFDRLAVTDRLTGLVNRRGAEQMIRREILRARRYASPISFTLFDIDDLQRINEKYGPSAGDQVLRQVARVIAGQLRESDLAVHWGEDAFLTLLPGTALENAMLCAERVRKAVARMSTFMNEAVLVSGGVVQLVPGESLDEGVKRAEALVEAAKSGGRNRVR